MTEKLFDSDPYLKEFEAEVSEIRALPNGQGVVMNRTAFFPEGGGQPSDSGELNGHKVLEIREENGEIIHVVDKGFQTGDRVRGVLDWERRFDLMQQHTGQHILSQAFLGNLGAETAGFHLGSDTVTIDLRVPGLSDEQVMNVEKQANSIVHENRTVRIHEMQAEEADSFPLRRRPVLTGMVRIVEIDQYDWTLCCGTHVRRTGDIGLIKVIKWEKYKGGTRVYFVCGGRAFRDYQIKTLLIRELSRKLPAGENEILERIEQWGQERKASEKRMAELLGRALEFEADRLLRSAETLGSLKKVSHLFKDRPLPEVQALAKKLIETEGVVAILGTTGARTTIYFARSRDLDLDMRRLAEAAGREMNGKGGGNSGWAQCSTADTKLAENAMKKASEACMQG